MNEFNEQLNQLAIAAQQHPPCSPGRQTALRQLVNGIVRSGQLCHPQRGLFPGRYEEIHAEAVQDLLLYICQSIHKYDSSRGSVMAWANMLLERRFFRQAVPKVLGKPTLKHVPLDDFEELASPQEPPGLTERLKESIEADPENLFKSQHLEGCPAANFQALMLKRLAGQTWDAIATEFDSNIGAISSFYSRCLKKFSPKLREYCID